MPAKIPVVEDHDESRKLLGLLLEREGYEVIYAEDRQRGYDCAEQEAPVLVVTDIAMPNVDGVEMIRMIRAHSIIKSVPVIAMTAFGGPALSKAVDGATATLRKPLQFDALLKLISNCLQLSYSFMPTSV